MSWAEHHRQSERYASEAEVVDKNGDSDRAVQLYLLAAEAEVLALKDLNLSKTRTLGITAVSVAALWFKAREYTKVIGFTDHWLEKGYLPAFAKDQLEELRKDAKCCGKDSSQVPTFLSKTDDSQSEYQQNIVFHQQQLEVARQFGDRQGEAISLSNLGCAYASLGEYRSAIDFYEQALKIDQASGDRYGEAIS